MGKSITDHDFFDRDAECVARDLLGKYICTKGDKKVIIIATEAYYYNEKDKSGKSICYGAGKSKKEAQKLVSAPLFERPGTWCVYGGQLLLSVTDDKFSDNVLIKVAENGQGEILKPGKLADELHLYKSQKDVYCKCHNQYSLDENSNLYLMDGEEAPNSISCRRKRVNSDEPMQFWINEEKKKKTRL